MEKQVVSRPSAWTDDFDPFLHLQQAFDLQMLADDYTLPEKYAATIACKEKPIELVAEVSAQPSASTSPVRDRSERPADGHTDCSPMARGLLRT